MLSTTYSKGFNVKNLENNISIIEHQIEEQNPSTYYDNLSLDEKIKLVEKEWDDKMRNDKNFFFEDLFNYYYINDEEHKMTVLEAMKKALKRAAEFGYKAEDLFGELAEKIF